MKTLKRITTFALFIFAIVGVLGLSNLNDNSNVYAIKNMYATVTVDGVSMEPLLYSGDSVKVKKNVYSEKLKINDIVVVDNIDNEYFQDVKLVKTVVAIEGDTISIRNNHLYINDVDMNKTAVCITLKDNTTTDTYTLQKGEFYVLGENRGQSDDSSVFGIVNQDNLYGKVTKVNGKNAKELMNEYKNS